MMECVLKTQSITSRDVPADSIGAPKLDFDGLLLFLGHFSYSAARCGLDWAHQPPFLASATA